MLDALNVTGHANSAAPRELCLACGLCCNGAIFADLKLVAGDDFGHFQALYAQHTVAADAAGKNTGTASRPVSKTAGAASEKQPSRLRRLPQPCVFFDGSHCRIYEDRPRHCREFECLLRQNVADHRLDLPAALRIVRTSREQLEHVRTLLERLGDTDGHLPFPERFRRTSRRLEHVGLEGALAEVFGDLTLAVHEMNCLVSRHFYNP